ncbi:MAG: hypothetical protein CFE21_02800 [Bacteroidetes bacterium B1(2017)]|nr:MAG: hypothetical protein CFE21_02800 [Bacteroidetes bacterium B1(2017)]
MGKSNKISANFTPKDKEGVIKKMGEAMALMPFLVNLTSEDRKHLRKMGPKSSAYVQQCLEGAIAFPGELKSNFNLAEMQKDVELLKNLLGLKVQLDSLKEKVDDTIMAAGADAMGAADEVYQSLKLSAKGNAGVKSAVELISIRFKGQGNFTEVKPPSN